MTISEDAARIARSIWREQLANGIGSPDEEAIVDTDDGLELWLGNRVYPMDTLEDAAAGDVAAIAEVRTEAGLPLLA